MPAVYARQANPLIDRMVQRFRSALGCGFVTNDAGARPLLAELAAGRRVGILIGPERTGLENAELILADAALGIPVNPAFFPLNLAQPALLVAYE